MPHNPRGDSGKEAALLHDRVPIDARWRPPLLRILSVREPLRRQWRHAAGRESRPVNGAQGRSATGARDAHRKRQASSSVENLRCRAPSTAGNVGQANPPDSIRRARRRNAGSTATDGGRSESGMRQDGARGGMDAATGWGQGGRAARDARPGGSRARQAPCAGRNFSSDAFGSERVEAASRSMEGVGPEGLSRGRARYRGDAVGSMRIASRAIAPLWPASRCRLAFPQSGITKPSAPGARIL